MTDTLSASTLGLGNPPNMASGSFTSDGNATSLTLGFMPRYIKVWDATDATQWEWMLGLAATTTIKTVTAGTMTSDTTSAILVGTDAGLNEPASSALLSAALCSTGKAITWMALG